MITIAGSGPSTKTVSRVTVATKKRSVPSDYVFCRFPFSHTGNEPLMVYYQREGEYEYCCDSSRWNAYYKKFTRGNKLPQRSKPSSGLCAVFCVVERWNPKEIGLIGFDWILDGNPDWEHDAIAEKACIESLVNIIDLRYHPVSASDLALPLNSGQE